MAEASQAILSEAWMVAHSSLLFGLSGECSIVAPLLPEMPFPTQAETGIEWAHLSS